MKKKKGRISFGAFFSKFFSFEKDTNLMDEVDVLFRRNIVIKNIIFVSNILYSILLFVISIGKPLTSTWLFTFLPFPLTFMINRTIKKLIYNDRKELLRQQIAMYMSSFYMFLSAILIYFKLKTTQDYLAEAGYMLLYYSLIVVSLYQSKKMLKQVFIWMIIIISILHFTITYDISKEFYANNMQLFLRHFFYTNEFTDIVLRTVILLCFMLVVYTITVIGERMHEARNSELSMRKVIQEDFTEVVSDLFKVMMETQSGYSEDVEQLPLLATMAEKLALFYGLSPSKAFEIKELATYHVDHHSDLSIPTDLSEEEQFNKLRKQTQQGSVIVKRIQLSQKCENIIRAHIQYTQNENFSKTMNMIQTEIESQIILLCDLYISLRAARHYKRPYPHNIAIDNMNKVFQIYFQQNLFNRFMKYASDFEEMYNNFG